MKIPSNWTFKSKDVAEHFDAHVREQLPFYDLVTDTIVHIARHYLPNNGIIRYRRGNWKLRIEIKNHYY